MSIRDIIEKWHLISANYARHGYTAAVHGRDFEEMRDDFASAIEELALMEAVCEAAVGYIEDRDWCVTALANAAHYLQDYRKTYGYGD